MKIMAQKNNSEQFVLIYSLIYLPNFIDFYIKKFSSQANLSFL